MRINRSVTVSVPRERAFRAFTEEIGAWWPLADGFSFVGDRHQDMTLEGREGGRLYERSRDGEEVLIGTVIVFEPPARVVFTWAEGSDGLERPTEVEVRFTEEDGATRVELEHTGFERYGDKAEEQHSSYEGGWVAVLGRYEKHLTA